MDRTQAAGHVGNRFVEEDLALGREPSVISAKFLNDVQEELCRLIEHFTPLDAGSQQQLKSVLLANFAQLSGASFTGALGSTASDRQVFGYQFSDISSSNAGTALFGNNCYLRRADNTYRYSQTHASMGARGIVLLPGVGLRWFDTGAVSTVAGQAFSPTLRNLSGSAGEVVMYSGSTAAPGTLKANGATGLSRVAYADLWAFAQASGNLAASEAGKQATQYGPGDGVSTFSLPDLRADFPRFWDDGRGIDAGRAISSWQAADFPSHSHSLVIGLNGVPGGDIADHVYGVAEIGSTTLTTASAGGSENRVRNVALLACIRY